MLRSLLAWISVAAGLVLLVWGVGGAAYAQSSEDAGLIQEIKPQFRAVTVSTGDKVYLSLIVIGQRGTQDRGLASGADIRWTATDGIISPSIEGNTEVIYTSPEEVGLYAVTATAVSNCEGICTATISVTVRARQSGPYIGPPPLPRILRDPEGNTYEVFTPEDGGTFPGDGFWISAESGVVQNGELIGVRMFENGPASNAGMSHHTYTLSGNQYRVSVIDAEGAPISSYSLNGTVTVCIPLPDELRTNVTDLAVVAKNHDGTLTPTGSVLQLRSSGAFICGSRSTLPATVAIGILGTPPEPEPTEMLPATGGAVPVSQGIIAWALLVGVALIATGTFASTYRRRRHQGIR